MILTFELDLPDELAKLRLPDAVAARLKTLIDRQDAGLQLTGPERAEAEGLVNVAEFLSLLRLRANRVAS